MPDRTARPGRRCARAVLTLLRDGRTRPDEWDRRERSAVTRLHLWAFRESGLPSWPLPAPRVVDRVRVEEDEYGVRPIRVGDAPTRGLRPIEEDPHRPHPHAAAWPDDAVLLTYRELRRLVSLHLERYLDDTTPARAMLEGDVPLRLSEVLA